MTQSNQVLVTFECAPNIALIKYWGKSNEELVLPLNGSISITLDHNVMCSKTSLMLIKKKTEESNKNVKIQIWLNKIKQEFVDSMNGDLITKKIKTGDAKDELINKKRFLNVLNKVRSNCSLEDPTQYDINICSINNFPTACGLASSASGFACLALCLGHAFKYNGDISELARIGSGSACRSCLEGFVKWSASDLSEKSIATMLYPTNHWPEMNVLILVLEDNRKDVSSTNGMRKSTLTSDLLKHRVNLVEKERLKNMEDHIEKRDFNKFAKLVMRDSNNFHSICMDTFPPLFYLNEQSHEIVKFVHEFNKFYQKTSSNEDFKLAYSFDAGPNAFLFVLDENLYSVINLLYKIYFSHFIKDENEFLTTKLISNKFKFSINDYHNYLNTNKNQLNDHFSSFSFYRQQKQQSNDTSSSNIKYLIHSKVGSKPLNHQDSFDLSLLDQHGLPK